MVASNIVHRSHVPGNAPWPAGARKRETSHGTLCVSTSASNIQPPIPQAKQGYNELFAYSASASCTVPTSPRSIAKYVHG